MIKYKHI